MTNTEMINMLRVITGEKDSDTLSTYLYLAKGKVLSQVFPYGGPDEVPSEYQSTLVEIAAFLLNKRGAEGESRHSENGIDRTYDTADIPAGLLRKLIPRVGVL